MSDRRAMWWIALALSTSAWIVLSPAYGQPSLWAGAVLLVFAGLAGAVASRGADEAGSTATPRWAIAVLVVAAGAAGYYASWGMRTALALFVFGASTAAVGGSYGRRCRRAAWGALAVGTIALVQAGVAGLYAALLGHIHATSILSFFDVWLMRALGRSVTTVGRTVYVATASGPVALVPSWDQLGVVFGLLVWSGFAVLVAGTRTPRRGRAFAKGTAVIAGFLLLRRLLLVLVAVETGSPYLFWNPIVLGVSIVPLIVLLARFSGWEASGIGRSIAGALDAPGRRAAAALVGALVSAACVLSTLYLIPAGPPVEGAVLFDETHGVWESTRTPMDTESYGLSTTYNYASLYDWLSYYYPVGHLTAPIDGAALERCAVLVLKTPSSPYTEAEVDAIEAFVRDGGGLFVIGDHTNVFGTTTVLNPVLARFDLALRYDSTYRLGSGSFTTYVPTRPCLDPIMQHVPRFEFLTSCSIEVSPTAYRTIMDNAVLSNQADYATRDFFPKQRYSLQSEFGQFVQAAAVSHGAGRVVVFTDSTCFSNFSMFMDGYPSFVLATIAFLTRENVGVPLRSLLAAIGGAAMAGLCVMMIRRRRVFGLAGLLAGVLLAWALFAVGTTSYHRAAYPLAEPSDDVPFVYFDVELSDIEIQPQPASAEAYDRTRQYDTFFVWSQRVGKIPQRVDAQHRGDVLGGRAYVIVNPVSEIDEAALAWIREYVAAGGRLILLDRCGRDPSGSDALLGAFDVASAGACGSERVIEGATITVREISPSLTLSISEVAYGTGRVILVSDSTAFANLSLGGAFTEPSGIQKALYDVAFWLFLGR